MSFIECVAQDKEQAAACKVYIEEKLGNKWLEFDEEYVNNERKVLWHIFMTVNTTMEREIGSVLMEASTKFPTAKFEFQFIDACDMDEEDYDEDMEITVVCSYENGKKSESSYS